MKTAFKRALHELLIKDGISLESGIVNQLVYLMAKVELEDKNESYNGFDLSSNEYNKSEQLEFSLTQMPFKELKKLLVLFRMSEDDYTVNAPLTFKDETFVMNVLLPELVKFYNSLKQDNPSCITYYQNKSKAILESTAVNTLKHYSQQAIDQIVDNNSDGHPNLLNALLVLKERINQLSMHPIFYKKIIQSKHHQHFDSTTQDEKLDKLLPLIREGVELFKQYNRCESVLAIKSFQSEMDTFLKEQFNISNSTCNVVEEAVLKAAQASLGKRGTSTMHVGSDPSRMVFTFKDMDKDNAAKVVSYFQKLGDKTAIEGYGGRAYGSYVPEAAMHKSVPTTGYHPREPEIRLEEHSIEVDGTFLYKILFPELKHSFGFLEADAEKLKELQAASRNCWDPRVWSNNRAKPVEPAESSAQNTLN